MTKYERGDYKNSYNLSRDFCMNQNRYLKSISGWIRLQAREEFLPSSEGSINSIGVRGTTGLCVFSRD